MSEQHPLANFCALHLQLPQSRGLAFHFRRFSTSWLQMQQEVGSLQTIIQHHLPHLVAAKHGLGTPNKQTTSIRSHQQAMDQSPGRGRVDMVLGPAGFVLTLNSLTIQMTRDLYLGSHQSPRGQNMFQMIQSWADFCRLASAKAHKSMFMRDACHRGDSQILPANEIIGNVRPANSLID